MFAYANGYELLYFFSKHVLSPLYSGIAFFNYIEMFVLDFCFDRIFIFLICFCVFFLAVQFYYFGVFVVDGRGHRGADNVDRFGNKMYQIVYAALKVLHKEFLLV